MRSSLTRAVYLLVAALVVPACASHHGGGLPAIPPPLARFAFVANNDGTVSGFLVDSQSGQLTADGFSAAYVGAAPSAVHQLALAPGGQLAWALRTGASPTISSFVVNPTTGALTPGAIASPLASIVSASALAIDPALRYGYVADGSAAGFVQAFSISGNGAFTALGPPVSTGAGTTHPIALAVPPSGNVVYALNQTTGTVAGFLGGSLTPLTTSPYLTGAAPLDLQIDPQGVFAFVLSTTPPAIWAYTIGADGSLSNVTGSPFPLTAITSPTFMSIDPLDRFVWAGNAAGQVSALALDSTTGVLSSGPIPGFSLPMAGTPLSLSVDPSGQLAFLGMQGGTVQSLTVQPNGTLVGPPPPAPSTISLAGVRTRGTVPSKVGLVQSTASVVRTPLYAYVGSASGISAFSITAGTGVLVPFSSTPLFAGTAFGSVTVDPYGRFAYATPSSPFSVPIGQYVISGGQLVPIASPPNIASATQILTDPSGQYVFAVSSGTLTTFPISQSTGALGAPSNLGIAGATFAAADPLGSFVLIGGSTNLVSVPIDAATGVPGAASVVSGSAVSAAVVSPTGLGAYFGAGTSFHFATVTSPATVTPAAAPTTLPSGNVVSLAMDAAGLLLYAASDAGSVFIYAVNPASPGAPTLIGSASISPGPAMALSTDPAGTFVYGTSSGNGSLWSYIPGGFGGNQLLTVQGTPVLVGAAPSAAAIAPLVQ